MESSASSRACLPTTFAGSSRWDADARVRWALLQFVRVDGDGPKSQRDVVVPLTQESLAELAGTARGTVNRVLREEQEQGAVLLQRGRVRVLEPATLPHRVRGLPR